MSSTTEQKGGTQVAITGLVVAFLCLAALGCYFVWILVPDEYLHLFHITHLPSKYWAVAIPAIMVVSSLYYFAVSFLLVFVYTYPLSDGHTVTDVDKKKETVVQIRSLAGTKNSVPPWVDIPADVASSLLFEPWKK